MLCRKLFKGFLLGGLVGIAVVQYLRRRHEAASDQAVSELRAAPVEQPADPSVVELSDAVVQETAVAEIESTETVAVDAAVVADTEGVEDSGADVGTEMIDVDEISIGEVEAEGVEDSGDDVRAAVIDIDLADADEPVEPDDLRKIEGIGPKIAEILNENGISTYAQLAAMNVDDLRLILDGAGSRFRLAVPTSWPQQAQLAADGDWDGLQAFQDSLKGGR